MRPVQKNARHSVRTLVRQNRGQLVLWSAVIATTGTMSVSDAIAANTTYLYNPIANTSAAPDNWSTSTSWSPTPQSSSFSELSIGSFNATNSVNVTTYANGFTNFNNNDITPANGTFQLNALDINGTVSGTGSITVSGGTIEFLNNGATGPAINPNANVVNWTVNNNLNLTNTTTILGDSASYGNNTGTLAGVISGAGGLVKRGRQGTVSLTNANTYSGQTQIQQGTLVVTSINSVSGPNHTATSSLGAPTTAANGLIILGRSGYVGTLKYNGPGETTDRSIQIETGTATGGGGVIDSSGSGALVLTGDFSTTTGGTGATGFSLTLQGSNASNNYVGGKIVDGASLGTVSLSKSGSGLWILGGNNTYTGVTTINTNGGTLQVGSGTTSGQLGPAAVTDNATLSFNRSDTLTVGNTITGTGKLLQAGSGTLILTAPNAYSSGTTISAGTLQLGAGGNSGSFGSGAVVDNSNLLFSRSDSVSFANTITGTGAVTVGGTGTVSFSSTANTYSGNTVINAGATVQLSVNNVIPDGSGKGSTIVNGYLDANGLADTINSPSGAGTLTNTNATTAGVFTINPLGASTTFAGTITQGTQKLRIVVAGAGTTVFAGDNNYSNQLFIQNNAVVSVATLGSSGDATTPLGAGGNNIAFGVGQLGGTLQYTGPGETSTRNKWFVSHGANANFDASGTGPLILSSATAISSDTTTAAGGTINLTGTNTGVNSFGLIISDNGSGGSIGSFSVAKTGTGYWALPSTNTYTGTTVITSGTLAINGAHTGGAAYTVGDGTNPATLAGTGTISNSGGISVAANATLSPGLATETSVKSLHTGSVSFAASSNFSLRINSDLATADQLLTTGPATVGSGLISLISDLGTSNAVVPFGSQIPIIVTPTDGTGGIVGVFSTTSLNIGNNSFNVAYLDPASIGTPTEVVLQAVPEPGTLSLVSMMASGILLRRRRRALQRVLAS